MLIYIDKKKSTSDLKRSVVNRLFSAEDLSKIVNEEFIVIGVLSNSNERLIAMSLVNDMEVPCFLALRKDKLEKNESLT